MTAGGGGVSGHPAPKKPPVTGWSTGDAPAINNPDKPSLNSGQQANAQAPPVPQQDGGKGATVVNTPSLDVFASNMGKLMAPVKDAWTTLNGVAPIAAGSFADATAIKTKVSGGGASTGGASAGDIVSGYLNVLNDLHKGLGDLQTAANQMSAKYTTADDLNGMSAIDLQNDMGDSANLFGQLGTDSGAAPSTTTGSSSS
jgi:hypothetical protein